MFQSGLRSYHSTDIALLKVCDNFIIASDSGLISLLLLLIVSAAFDTVYSCISINIHSYNIIEFIVYCQIKVL